MARPALAAPLEVDPRLLMTSGLMSATATAGAVAPDEAPTRIEGERIDGRTDVELNARGKARLQRRDTVLQADSLRLDQETNDVTAEGNVLLTRPGDSISGPRAVINIDTYYGDFFSPTYTLTRSRKFKGAPQFQRKVVSGGDAEVIKLEGENQYSLKNASYSTCPAPSPDWYLRSGTIDLDVDRNHGEAYNSTLWMKGVPMMWMPWAGFPLDGGRQSGLLPPTFGTANTTGLDISLPYYFNIAPNYDATLAPRWMANIGTQLSGEFRYLGPGYFGVMRGEVLPQDKVTGEARSFVTLRHDYNLNGWSGLLDVSNASDEFYFSDLGTRLSTASQTLLTRQVTANTGGAGWSFGLNAQNYQTLAGYIGSEPYQRLPQLTGRISLPDVKGFSFVAPAEITRFAHPSNDEGARSWANPQVSLPLQSPAAYLTPKLGIHLTQYQLDRRTTVGESNIGRAVPTFSLDSGLNFERDFMLGGTEQIQTLEPRLFYVRTPYRKQDSIPLFDSGLADYNFAQLFSENRFAGNDRIGDANQLTAALSSRLIESGSGEEWLRATVGQRYHFSDQKVGLGASNTLGTSTSDNWLAAVSGRITKQILLDSSYEYDPNQNQDQSGVLALRYTDGPGRVLSAAYRYRRSPNPTLTLRDYDLSAQWRLFGNYTGVARYNYNMHDRKLSEALAGVEYNAGCWILRVVWHSILNTTNANVASSSSEIARKEYTNSFFIQLELDGFASIGSSPISLLKRNIGGYQRFGGAPIGDPAE